LTRRDRSSHQKRIQRGSLGKEPEEDGRVYVYLDLSQDIPQPESQVYRDPLVEELVEEPRDRVAFLERALERRSVEAERSKGYWRRLFGG